MSIQTMTAEMKRINELHDARMAAYKANDEAKAAVFRDALKHRLTAFCADMSLNRY